jgi:hypothetical protein
MAIGPTDGDFINGIVLPQPEVDGEHGLGTVTGTGFHLTGQCLVTQPHSHLSPDRRSIAATADQLQSDPVAVLSQLIEIECGLPIAIVDGQIQPSIAIEIGDGHTPAVLDFVYTGWSGDIDELLTIAGVGKQAVILVAIP